MLKISQKLDTLFNMLFVMMEGMEVQARPSMWRKTVILFMIDYLQLFRVLTPVQYGWSEATSELVQKFDIVWWFTTLVSKIVPKYVFFIGAMLTVSGALADAFYVAKLFEGGNVQKMWPVKVLRFSVVTMVTTLFSSVTKWLLIPFSCLLDDDYSLSEVIHGEGTECTPWGWPEVLASAPMIVVFVFYICFAVTASFFNLQTNVLSRTPTSSNTGRVEVMFALMKVFSTCMVFLAEYITSTAVCSILFMMISAVLYNHCKILPFHHHPTNMLRGGIYGAVSWVCLSGIIVSSDVSQTIQWILLAMVPVSFLGGIILVHISRMRIFKELDRLRGEWEERQAAIRSETISEEYVVGGCVNGEGMNGDDAPSSSNEGGKKMSNGFKQTSRNGYHSHQLKEHGMENGSRRKKANSIVPGITPFRSAKRRAFDAFFDSSWERKRAFTSGQHALTCARILLYERAKGDIPFLQYLVDRGQSEFPDFDRLYFFKVLLMEFVFDKPIEAANEEKKMKANKETLSPDLRYVLYTLERKTAQESAAQNLGKEGQVSAINLMEFNIGFERAKHAHLASVVEMKAFWHAVSRRSNKDQVEAMVKHLEIYTRVSFEARKEYHALLYKYQQSVDLLFSYANFEDHVMNNIVEADAKRAQATALQSDPRKAEDQSEQDDGDKRPTDQKSAMSGASSESKRLQASRSFWAWRHQIMSEELMRLISLKRKIQVAIFLVIVFATVAFVVSDFILFKTMAKKELHMIRKIGDVRTSSVIIAYLVRSLILETWKGDNDAVEHIRQEGIEASAHFAEEHLHIYEAIDFKHADEAFNYLPLVTRIPRAGGWRNENHTLWETGNDYSRRSHMAFSLPVEELQNPSYVLDEISEEKRNVPFVFENFYRALIPAIEHLEHVYLDELHVIRDTTVLLVSLNSTFNAILISMIAISFLRGLSSVVHVMEYKRIICLLALALPKPTAKKLYNFYKETERQLKALEDEDIEKQEIMDMDYPAPEGGEDSQPGAVKSPVASDRSPVMDSWVSGPSSGKGKSALSRGVGEGYSFPSPKGQSTSNTIVLPLTAANLAAYAVPKSPNSVMRFISGNKSRLESKPDEITPAVKSEGSSSGAASMPESVKNRLEAVSEEFDVHPRDNESDIAGLKRASVSSTDMLDRFVNTATGEHSVLSTNALGTPGPAVSALNSFESGEDSLVMITESEQENQPVQTSIDRIVEETPKVQFRGVIGTEQQGDQERADSDLNSDECFRMVPPEDLDLVAMQNDPLEDQGEDSGVSDGEIEGGLDAQGLKEIEEKLEQEIERRDSGAKKDANEASDSGIDRKAEDAEAMELFSGMEGSVVLVNHQRDDEITEEDGKESSASNAGLKARDGLRREPLIPVKEGEDIEISHASQDVTLQFHQSGHTSPDGVHSPTGRRSPRSSLKGSFRYLQERKQMKLESSLPSIGGAPQEFTFGGSFRSQRSRGSLRSGDQEGSQSPLTKMIRFSSFRKGSMTNIGSKPQSSMDNPSPAGPPSSDGNIENLISSALEMVTNPEVITSLNLSLKTRRVWYSRSMVYLVSFVVLLTLSLMSTIYPSRTQPELLSLAPIINEAGLREELGRAVVFYARELILDDGLSRHTKQELSDATSYLIQELRKADHAIRLGGLHDIEKGADNRNTLHNEIMYGHKCPWREDENDCHVDEKPSASDMGLLYLFKTFVDAAENVLLKYGLNPAEGDARAHFMNPRLNFSDGDKDLFAEANPHPDSLRILEEDEDLRLLQDSFDGHLFKGMRYIELTFDQEMDHLLDEAVHLNEILYSTYVVVLMFGFYFGLFRRTVRHAEDEAKQARECIIQIPVHVLSQSETTFIQHFFCGSSTADDEAEGNPGFGGGKQKPSIASMASAVDPHGGDWFSRTFSKEGRPRS